MLVPVACCHEPLRCCYHLRLCLLRPIFFEFHTMTSRTPHQKLEFLTVGSLFVPVIFEVLTTGRYRLWMHFL